jgi:hypothetical protein
MNVNYTEIKNEWPSVSMFRGIRLKYKGKELYFPKVYLGPVEMSDFDKARASMEFKQAKDSEKESTATRKTMTLCSRVLLQDAYAPEGEVDATGKPVDNVKMNELHEKRARARRRLEKKIAAAEDEAVKENLQAELEALPELPQPAKVFPNDEEVLTFSITNMSGEGTLPIDNIRLIQAFSQINYFESEEVEDFMNFPG